MLLLSLKFSSLNQSYEDPRIAWITIIRFCFCTFAYFMSSFLSYSVNHIIIYQSQLDVNDTKNRIRIAIMLLCLIIPYVVLACIEFYSGGGRQAKYYQAEDISLQFNMYSRFVLIAYNFLNYFITNYYVKKLYGESNNPKTLAIQTLVQRLRLYPMFQFISFITEFIRCIYYGFSQSNITSFKAEPSYVCFAIFAEVLFYLDPLFMLIVFIYMTPGAIIKIKQVFLNIDIFGNDIYSQSEYSSNDTKAKALANQMKNETEINLSEYRDSEINQMNDNNLTTMITSTQTHRPNVILPSSRNQHTRKPSNGEIVLHGREHGRESEI